MIRAFITTLRIFLRIYNLSLKELKQKKVKKYSTDYIDTM